MLLFIAGVAVLVRPLVPALAAQVLRPAARSRATLRLAAGELQRSPSRTAYTVGAVVLALALVIGVQVDIASFQNAFNEGLTRLIQADLIVRARDCQPYGAAFCVTYEDAAAAWGLGVGDVIDVFVRPGVASASVAAAIRNHLGPRYGLSPDTRRQFIDRLSAIVSSLQRLIGSVQIVAVLVAALGVADTLLISTFAPRRDLRILPAVGLRPPHLPPMVALS